MIRKVFQDSSARNHGYLTQSTRVLKLGRLRRQRVEQLMEANQRKAQGLWLSNFFLPHAAFSEVSNPAKAVGITNGEPEKEDAWRICRTPTCLLISYWLRFVFQSWTCLQWCGILILKTWDLYLGSLCAYVGSLLQAYCLESTNLVLGSNGRLPPSIFDPFLFPPSASNQYPPPKLKHSEA